MAQIFTAIIIVWPSANWAMAINNLTSVIEVTLIDVTLVKGFLYISVHCCTHSTIKRSCCWCCKFFDNILIEFKHFNWCLCDVLMLFP